MSAFTKILDDVVAAEPYHGSQRALARVIGINHAHLCRVLAGERAFSPQVVGRIARLLGDKQAQTLIKTYLQEIAVEIAQQQGRKAVEIL